MRLEDEALSATRLNAVGPVRRTWTLDTVGSTLNLTTSLTPCALTVLCPLFGTVARGDVTLRQPQTETLQIYTPKKILKFRGK
jgi:hypothetical protein